MLEPKMEFLKCPKCEGTIKLGIAIKPTVEYGVRPTPFDKILNHETMKIINIYKCNHCGYSCDDERDLLHNEKNENTK